MDPALAQTDEKAYYSTRALSGWQPRVWENVSDQSKGSVLNAIVYGFFSRDPEFTIAEPVWQPDERIQRCRDGIISVQRVNERDTRADIFTKF